MKPIQILLLSAAMAVTAAAQNAKPSPTPASGAAKSAPKAGGGNQPSGVKLIVPKPGAQTNASGARNSTPAAGTRPAAKGTPAKPPMISAKPAANATKTSGVNNKGAGANNKGGGVDVQPGKKAPVLTAMPAQKPVTNAKSAPLAPTSKTGKMPKKSTAGKATTPGKNQVEIVPQKTAGGTKSGDNKLASTSGAAGRRDPFMSIIRNAPTSASGPNCSVGKRCLFIPELELKGIAKDPEGQMLAVVVSNTHRAYFLRENDQVFNGSVQKITSDSVVFREFATDHLGRETAHEVVKRIPKS